MPTKAELVDFATQHGIDVNEAMLKGDIETALREGGYDPVTLEPLSVPSDTETTTTTEGAQPMADEDTEQANGAEPQAAQTPPIPQFLPGNAAGDPTVTTLEQEAATVTPESIKAASFARMPMPSWAYPSPPSP